jgi:pimeloyl-ACP methyl ester carboxylesterase
VIDLNYSRRGRASRGTSSLVLIHGIGSRWQMWEPVLDRLAAAHDVIALDLPGFGASPPLPPDLDHSPAGLAAAVHGFLGALGVENPHVAGNSLGGWVALELGRREAVSSVTGFSPAGFAGRAGSVWSRSCLIATHRAARLVSGPVDRLSGYSWFRRVGYQQMVAHPENVPPDDVAGSVRALAQAAGFDRTLRATTDRNFRLGRPLGIPVTIAWGEKDRLLLPSQARRAMSELPGARLVRLPDCGHIPTYDNPQLVAQVILDGMSAGRGKGPAGRGEGAAG